MGETDLQLGGGYAYQWECAILLALNYFYEPVRYNLALDGLASSFLGQVEAVQLEGEDRESGRDLEDINLLAGERLILIQVKTKEAEGERWTLTDPLLLKALYRFYKHRPTGGEPEEARFVFLTNRPFNPDLVQVKNAIAAGTLGESAEADRLLHNLERYAREKEAPAVDRAHFLEMLAQTALVEFLSVEAVKANIQVKLQAYGRRDWEQAHAVLFEHFARQSTHTGGGQVTRASLFELLGKRPDYLPGPGSREAGDLARRDRKMEILLKRVQADWVHDFLEKREAIHAQLTRGSGLFLIRKRWAPEMLAQAPIAPAEIAPGESGAGEAIPPETSLLEIFEQAGSLLILGEPGSGKTILLLELASLLAERAAANPGCPVPVVLHLAAWAAQRKPLGKWIQDELNKPIYGIPRPDCQAWLEKDQISLLLDGLDEIPEELRDDCVRAINGFVEQHGLAEIAVTCRTQEYQVLADRLNLRRAMRLEALSPDQVQAYFDAAGSALSGLRSSLEADAPLQEMASNPLMLYILSATYENEPVQVPAARALENQADWRTGLFGKYVQSMLQRIQKEFHAIHKPIPFGETEMMHWLSWLARRMDEHTPGLYSLDQMQPSWLPSPAWAWAYLFASRLAIGLVGGLLGSLLVGLGLRQAYGLPKALRVGLVEGLLGGLAAGVMMGLVDLAWIRLHRRQARPGLSASQPASLWPAVLRFVTAFLVVFAGVSLAFAVLDLLTTGYGWLYAGLQLGVLFGLCASLVFAFGSRGMRTGLDDDIQTVERLSWTTHAAWRGALWGGAAGALAGVLMGFFFGCNNPLVYPLCRSGYTSSDIFLGIFLITGIFAALIGFLFSGLGGTFLKIEKASPIQGVRISLANALQIGGAVGLLFAAAGALVAWLVGRSLEDALTYGLYGLFIGVLAGLYYGGLFALQYLVLGLLLWRSGCFPRPWKRIEFLDYAAQCIFLQRVGGAYRFFHRYLQDYFKGVPSELP